MLHMVFQSLNDNPILERLGSDNDVIFFEKAIFCLSKKGKFADMLMTQFQYGNRLYVFKDDIEAGGITLDELIVGVIVIDYADWVDLTVQNSVIQSWT